MGALSTGAVSVLPSDPRTTVDAGHGGPSVPFLDNAKGSVQPEQDGFTLAPQRMWVSHPHLPQAPEPRFK